MEELEREEEEDKGEKDWNGRGRVKEVEREEEKDRGEGGWDGGRGRGGEKERLGQG